jgi:hypothetical protein
VPPERTGVCLASRNFMQCDQGFATPASRNTVIPRRYPRDNSHDRKVQKRIGFLMEGLHAAPTPSAVNHDTTTALPKYSTGPGTTRRTPTGGDRDENGRPPRGRDLLDCGENKPRDRFRLQRRFTRRPSACEFGHGARQRPIQAPARSGPPAAGANGPPRLCWAGFSWYTPGPRE